MTPPAATTCVYCGYNLRATETSVCPECGGKVESRPGTPCQTDQYSIVSFARTAWLMVRRPRFAVDIVRLDAPMPPVVQSVCFTSFLLGLSGVLFGANAFLSGDHPGYPHYALLVIHGISGLFLAVPIAALLIIASALNWVLAGACGVPRRVREGVFAHAALIWVSVSTGLFFVNLVITGLHLAAVQFGMQNTAICTTISAGSIIAVLPIGSIWFIALLWYGQKRLRPDDG